MKKYFVVLFATGVLFSQQPTPLTAHGARPSPDWIKHGIVYEIYPRAFSAEGTFAAIEKKLPQLKKLGVTVLWLMPIHPIGEEKRKGTLGSPYSIKDFYGINPEFGTVQDFKRLVRAAHREGFKIIIDLVANHTSWDSKMIKEHPDWFTKDSSGHFISPVADWSDVADLNYDNPMLRRSMIDMMAYWVRDVGIDGFRCDVAEMVPTDFWNDARTALDSIKPVMMLSEGQAPEHHLKAFDVSYSWNFYHLLAPVLNGTVPAYLFDSLLIRESHDFPNGSLRLRFSSNHDENAWDKPDVGKFGPDGAKLAAVLVNTFPGVPLLYNGQEVGNPMTLGLFEKPEIDWTADKTFRNFYEKLYSIRKKHPALTAGDYRYISNSRPEKVFSFLRTRGNDTVVTVINFSSQEEVVRLTFPGELASARWINAFSGRAVASKSVETITLQKHGYKVFVNR